MAEATKWPPAGSYCCFLGIEQEWIYGGSNKMAADRVLLLLFKNRAGMDLWRKQQNGHRQGLIVAFYDESRNELLTVYIKKLKEAKMLRKQHFQDSIYGIIFLYMTIR